MSKVRPGYIKNRAREIYQENPEKISTDFELNKIYLEDNYNMTRKIRNRMAGFLVVLKKTDDKRHTYKRRLSRKEMKKLKRKKKYAGGRP